MDKKEVIIEKPLLISGVKVVVAAEVVLNCSGGNGGVFLFAIKRPVYTVVVSPSARRAFTATGEDIPIRQVIEEVPGIESIINS